MLRVLRIGATAGLVAGLAGSVIYILVGEALAYAYVVSNPDHYPLPDEG